MCPMGARFVRIQESRRSLVWLRFMVSFVEVMVEFRQLEYFKAVAELSSFRKAAEELHVSQPAITTAIKNLEEELQVALLVRDKKSVMLTLEGELFLSKADDILRRLREINEELKGKKENIINIGIVPVAGASMNSILFKGFSRIHPEVQFKLVELGSLGVDDALRRDEIDLGFMILMDDMKERYEWKCIEKGEAKVVVHKDNPLARLERVPVVRLDGEPIISLPPHAYLDKLIRAEFTRFGIVPKVLATPWQLLTSFGLVENNIGVTFVWGDNFKAALKTSNLVAIPLDPPIPYELGFAWKKGKRLSRAAKQCVSYMKEQVKDQKGL